LCDCWEERAKKGGGNKEEGGVRWVGESSQTDVAVVNLVQGENSEGEIFFGKGEKELAKNRERNKGGHHRRKKGRIPTELSGSAVNKGRIGCLKKNDIQGQAGVSEILGKRKDIRKRNQVEHQIYLDLLGGVRGGGKGQTKTTWDHCDSQGCFAKEKSKEEGGRPRP